MNKIDTDKLDKYFDGLSVTIKEAEFNKESIELNATRYQMNKTYTNGEAYLLLNDIVKEDSKTNKLSLGLDLDVTYKDENILSSTGMETLDLHSNAFAKISPTEGSQNYFHMQRQMENIPDGFPALQIANYISTRHPFVEMNRFARLYNKEREFIRDNSQGIYPASIDNIVVNNEQEFKELDTIKEIGMQMNSQERYELVSKLNPTVQDVATLRTLANNEQQFTETVFNYSRDHQQTAQSIMDPMNKFPSLAKRLDIEHDAKRQFNEERKKQEEAKALEEYRYTQKKEKANFIQKIGYFVKETLEPSKKEVPSLTPEKIVLKKNAAQPVMRQLLDKGLINEEQIAYARTLKKEDKINEKDVQKNEAKQSKSIKRTVSFPTRSSERERDTRSLERTM